MLVIRKGAALRSIKQVYVRDNSQAISAIHNGVVTTPQLQVREIWVRSGGLTRKVFEPYQPEAPPLTLRIEDINALPADISEIANVVLNRGFVLPNPVHVSAVAVVQLGVTDETVLYAWRRVSGSTRINISSLSAISPTFSCDVFFAQPEVAVYRLNVNVGSRNIFKDMTVTLDYNFHPGRF